MIRRDVLLLGVAGSLAILRPRELCAQARKDPARIGVMLPVPGNDQFLEAFRAGLLDLGWKPDTDFILEVRRADGTMAQFRQFGSEFSALSMDVTVTASTAAATALGETSKGRPVIFVGTFDPVAAGLVDSMEHPGRNLTGTAGFQSEIAANWVSILREIAPRVERMGVFSNPSTISKAGLAGWKAVAEKSAEVFDVIVESVADIAPAVARVAQDQRAGIIVVPHTFPFANRKLVTQAMTDHRVPTIYGIAEMVRVGGLISYGQDLGAQWRMAASYVDKVLKGAKPSDIPAIYANKYSLAINTGTAEAIGLQVPPTLLARADEVLK